MKKLILFVLLAPAAMFAATIVQTVTALGPSDFAPATSTAAYQANVVSALHNGLVGIGDFSTDPSAYNQISAINHGDMSAHPGFPNWRGIPNPGAPFAGERGTFLWFSTRITASTPGEMFSLDSVVFTQDSTDTLGVWDFGPIDYFTLGGGTLDYNNTTRVGYIGGGSVGIADGATTVDELILLTAIFYDLTGYSGDAAGLAQGIADAAARDGSYLVTTTFTVNGVNGSAAVNVNAIPEPATFAITGLGLLAFGAIARRFRR